VGRLAAYGYAAFSSVTDVFVGIGADELTQLNVERGLPARTEHVDRLVEVGNDLGEIGVWCFIAACAATALAIVVRVGRRALAGAIVLMVAGVLFTGGWHIYWPRGCTSGVRPPVDSGRSPSPP
jgi:hypothetical protein